MRDVNNSGEVLPREVNESVPLSLLLGVGGAPEGVGDFVNKETDDVVVGEGR